MYLIAIVILNYNGRHILAKFLPSVVQYSKPYPVFMVDNGSTDDSVNFTQQNYPAIHCFRLTRNEGFGKGYNMALKQIKAKYYVLLNSDVAVTPNWISPILRLMESNPEIAVCQPKILSWQKQDYFEYAGAAGGMLDKFGYPFCRGRLFTTLERDHGQYNDIREIFWASGACFFIRSKVFWELSGFDENLWAYYEEIDLCWRIQKKGLKVYYCGYSKVYHLGSATLGSNSSDQTYLKFKNRALILYKHTPQDISISKNVIRALLDLLAAIKMFFSGKPHQSKAILKANIDFFKQKNRYQPPQKACSLKNLYQGLLPFDYFLKRKKYFSELDARKFS